MTVETDNRIGTYHGIDLSDPSAVGRAIKASLAARGIHTSVTKGKGSVRGWLSIRPVMPGEAENGALADALSCPHRFRGSHDVPASYAHRREFLDRAAGRVFVVAEAYWD